jgi:hypothetical protein
VFDISVPGCVLRESCLPRNSRTMEKPLIAVKATLRPTMGPALSLAEFKTGEGQLTLALVSIGLRLVSAELTSSR